jgi:hypothetical protein
MPHPRYPHMFSPLQDRAQQVKNRIIMGSMHSGLEEAPDAAARLSAYFVERVQRRRRHDHHWRHHPAPQRGQGRQAERAGPKCRCTAR